LKKIGLSSSFPSNTFFQMKWARNASAIIQKYMEWFYFKNGIKQWPPMHIVW
jgi:hypothetical protein